MITSDFARHYCCASAVGVVLISSRQRRLDAPERRMYSIIACFLIAAALLYTFRPNVPCIRMNETRLASSR